MNSLNYQGVEVSVNVNGRPVRTHLHDGKFYIESREGTQYTLEFKNNNAFRVEVVASVDGLSVINGKLASASDSGYVVPAWGRLSIKGYRKDNVEVGAFKFTSKANAYATEKGSSENTGVIAFAIWREKVAVPNNSNIMWIAPNWGTYPSYGWSVGGYVEQTSTIGVADNVTIGYNASLNSCSAGGLLRSMSAQSPVVSSYCCDSHVGQSHGTTWGEAIKDEVVTVEFERGWLLYQNEIFYDSRESLLARGVRLAEEKLLAKPRGFPADFATPPRYWRG